MTALNLEYLFIHKEMSSIKVSTHAAFGEIWIKFSKSLFQQYDKIHLTEGGSTISDLRAEVKDCPSVKHFFTALIIISPLCASLFNAAIDSAD